MLDELIRGGDRVLGLARSFPADHVLLANSHPHQVNLRECDLSRPEMIPTANELDAFVADAREAVLINNAATGEPVGAVGSLAAAALTSAVTVNLLAPMLLTNAFLAALRNASSADSAALAGSARVADSASGIAIRGGLDRVRILFISSSVATRPKAGTACYCAGKAGGEMFFETLRAEVAHDPRVSVETIDPGGMDTDMHAVLRGLTGVYFPDQERLRELAEAGRLSKPTVIARRILARYLSDHAGGHGFMTGSTSSTSTPPASLG